MIDLGTSFFSVDSVSNLIWDDANFWMLHVTIVHQNNYCQYILMTLVSPLRVRSAIWLPMHRRKKGWNSWKIPGGDAKIVSLNSVGWSLVFDSVLEPHCSDWAGNVSPIETPQFPSPKRPHRRWPCSISVAPPVRPASWAAKKLMEQGKLDM